MFPGVNAKQSMAKIDWCDRHMHSNELCKFVSALFFPTPEPEVAKSAPMIRYTFTGFLVTFFTILLALLCTHYMMKFMRSIESRQMRNNERFFSHLAGNDDLAGSLRRYARRNMLREERRGRIASRSQVIDFGLVDGELNITAQPLSGRSQGRIIARSRSDRRRRQVAETAAAPLHTVAVQTLETIDGENDVNNVIKTSLAPRLRSSKQNFEEVPIKIRLEDVVESETGEEVDFQVEENETIEPNASNSIEEPDVLIESLSF